ncbi:hypothetical protein P5673_031541 [Acropora cervicornis]|uniref:Uncharacterized protein n=1 Tax=Acropora cervicornis TaxID=6130 RepID=A0AAD9PSJ1_ACRCE|nr:hypothetical protein P5673_031541 [Acropora cervicornis]
MKRVIEILANPFCEVIRPLCVDYNLIEVNDGRCWSIKERRFLDDAIKDKDIGHVTPRAFSTYDATKVVEPKYFKEILENSLPEAEISTFCEDFLKLLNHNQKRHKDRVPCLIGAANSGKTSLFQPLLGLIHHSHIATISKQRVFNKAMINRFTELIFIDEASPSTLAIDDWKILTQGGYTACDVKYKTAKSFINRCPMLLTAQQQLEFGPEDQPAMDRRLRNYAFKSLPNPKKKAAEWLRKHPMGCVVWASNKARPASDHEESSDGGSGENEASQIDDGILNDEEKEALRTLAMAEDCTGPPEDAEQTLAEDEERSEEDLNSDDDQRISNMRKALHQSTPGSLRHRQITSMLQTCLREREEQRARDELHYQRRRDRLVARGVPRAHADLLPKNASDPLPIVLKNDLDVLRQKIIEEEMERRKLKARQAFEGRANLEAYVDVLCNKLKLHHQSLGAYNTAEALEERRRVGVDLGILRQQDQHLVRCVHEPLPTRSELACEEVSTETAQSDDESMFLTPLPATEVVPASVPDDCAIPDELRRPHGTKKSRSKIRRSQTETPNKRSKNTILNYFHSQKS